MANTGGRDIDVFHSYIVGKSFVMTLYRKSSTLVNDGKTKPL